MYSLDIVFTKPVSLRLIARNTKPVYVWIGRGGGDHLYTLTCNAVYILKLIFQDIGKLYIGYIVQVVLFD